MASELTTEDILQWRELMKDVPEDRLKGDLDLDQIAAMRRCTHSTAQRWLAHQVELGLLTVHKVKGEAGRPKKCWRPTGAASAAASSR